MASEIPTWLLALVAGEAGIAIVCMLTITVCALVNRGQ
jgi:hypothetical protein